MVIICAPCGSASPVRLLHLDYLLRELRLLRQLLHTCGTVLPFAPVLPACTLSTLWGMLAPATRITFCTYCLGFLLPFWNNLMTLWAYAFLCSIFAALWTCCTCNACIPLYALLLLAWCVCACVRSVFPFAPLGTLLWLVIALDASFCTCCRCVFPSATIRAVTTFLHLLNAYYFLLHCCSLEVRLQRL